MLKKYFIFSFIFVFSFLFVNHSFAAFNLTNSCLSTSTTQTISVIAPEDLSGVIPLCMTASANFPVNVTDANFNQIYSTSTAGTSYFNYPSPTVNPNVITFATSTFNQPQTYQFYVSDSASPANTNNATISLIPTPAPITLIIHNNTTGVDVPNGGNVNQGDALTFSCTNSLNMYFDSSAAGGNIPIATATTSPYAINYNKDTTPLAAGSHAVGCTNIGTPGNDANKSFVIVAKTMSGSLTATPNPCTIASGASSCSSTLNWSVTNPVVVGGSAVTSDTNSSGATAPNTTVGTGDSGSVLATVPYAGRNFYLYNNGSQLGTVTVTAQCTTGTSWDGNKCSPTDSNNPTCGFTDATNKYISCSCPGGVSSLILNNTDGTSQATTTTFAWNNLQYQYQITCTGGSPILYPALQRPYTHFLSFNVSAGYIKPGGSIDMNWVVQDPTTTCKIVGVDLKTGAEIFNSTGGNYSAINTSVTVSKSSSTTQNFSTGSFKALMGAAFTVNNSARFTASCDNNSSYMPGHYQLVRDVYTTTSQEK